MNINEFVTTEYQRRRPLGKCKNLTGCRIGRLLVLVYECRNKHGEPVWGCKCDCGEICIVQASLIVMKKIKSCGCILRERNTSGFRRTHGEGVNNHRSPEHVAWGHMLSRCRNPNNSSYYRYGARGIKVCERWMKFENFLADMGRKPTPKHSLDRINNDGNYEPGNCRWATTKEQARNKSNNRVIEFNGKKKTLAEWSDDIGIQEQCMRQRLRLWTLKEACSTPKVPQPMTRNWRQKNIS